MSTGRPDGARFRLVSVSRHPTPSPIPPSRSPRLPVTSFLLSLESLFVFYGRVSQTKQRTISLVDSDRGIGDEEEEARFTGLKVPPRLEGENQVSATWVEVRSLNLDSVDRMTTGVYQILPVSSN